MSVSLIVPDKNCRSLYLMFVCDELDYIYYKGLASYTFVYFLLYTNRKEEAMARQTHE